MAIRKDLDQVIEGFLQCEYRDCTCTACPYNESDDCTAELRDDIWYYLHQLYLQEQPTTIEQPPLPGLEAEPETFEDKLERIADILKEKQHERR